MKLVGGMLLLVSAAGAAQDPGDEPPPVTFPTIARQAPTLAGFVPTGWVLETQAEGDLNGDRRPDAMLVLRMNDPKNLVASTFSPHDKYNSNPRMLVVAFAGKTRGYALAAADYRLIPRLENQNQDDPLDEVAIRRGTLRVRLHSFVSAGGWWMGNVVHTLRWQHGSFKLIGYERDGVTRNTGETDRVSINYLTRIRLVETGNIDGSIEASKRHKLPTKPLIGLAEIGDGLMFHPGEQ